MSGEQKMKSERKEDKCMNEKKKETRKDGGINKWKKGKGKVK